MFKYLVACVAALYCVLILFGNESRRPEVARQSQDDVTGFSLASFKLPEVEAPRPLLSSGITEAQAVQIAMQAGRDHRANRVPSNLRGVVAAIEPRNDVTEAAAAETAELWYVTGTRVNLRSGPGTGNAVVGQMVLGDAAEVLDDQNGWYQVRAEDGRVTGWIFGEFLTDSRPG